MADDLINPAELIMATMKGIANAINKQSIEKWVADLMKKDPNTPNRQTAVRDSAFEKLVNTKAATNGVISGLAGLAPGLFSIPAEAGKLAAEWAMKAQIAYSVACLYGRKPSNSDTFMVDLFALTAGLDLVKDSASEVGFPIPWEQLIEAAEKVIKTVFNNPMVQKKLCEKLGEKMVKRMAAVGVAYGSAKAAKEVAEKFVAPLNAFKDGIVASMDIQKFGTDARNYYFKLPNPFGIYVSARFGAALDFASSGEVKVRPRFPHPDGLFTGDIRQGVELGKGKYERDKGAITFSTVSWEKSMYNAPRPVAKYPNENWDFINVEPNLSNKVCNLNIDGEEHFYGRDTINGKWERVDPPRVNLTIRFEANGGTPGPANKVLTSGSSYGGLPGVTKAGFDFGGWWTSADGGTKVESSSKVDDSHTLYARWNLKNVKVNFSANGGTPNPQPRDVSYGSAYGSLPSVSRDKFTFDGWFTSGGKQITDNTIMTEGSNHTLTARWTAVPQASTSTSAPSSSSSSRPSASYGIGETGPGGGIVFATGRECTYRDIGGGKLNYEQASKAPKNFNEGGKSDWRLPTKQELIQIYENLYKKGKGNFQSDSYVSGTVASGFVYAHNFASDTRNDKGDMNSPRYVRAVRNF